MKYELKHYCRLNSRKIRLYSLKSAGNKRKQKKNEGMLFTFVKMHGIIILEQIEGGISSKSEMLL